MSAVDRFVQLWRHDGRPWCDVCDAAAVHTPQGWRHATPQHPLGAPIAEGDHPVTADAWWNSTPGDPMRGPR